MDLLCRCRQTLLAVDLEPPSEIGEIMGPLGHGPAGAHGTGGDFPRVCRAMGQRYRPVAGGKIWWVMTVFAALVVIALAGCQCCKATRPAARSVSVGSASVAQQGDAAGCSVSQNRVEGSSATIDATAVGRAGGGGMKAYIDPTTGNLADQPGPGMPALSGDVLVPEGEPRENSASGGGVIIGPSDQAHSREAESGKAPAD